MEESISEQQSPFKVLVFSKTEGYRHQSIPAGIQALKKLGVSKELFHTDDSEDASLINIDNLSHYTLVIFLHTSGNFLNSEQLSALQSYVRSGGGFVGIHCASAGLFDEPWYGELIGAVFDGHPEPQDGTITIETPVHGDALTAGLSGRWEWYDEWYNFTSNPRNKVNVLMTVDEKDYSGGTLGDDHPLAWYREFDGGRTFYTALGHFDEAWNDEKFRRHVLNGILFAAGKSAMMESM